MHFFCKNSRNDFRSFTSLLLKDKAIFTIAAFFCFLLTAGAIAAHHWPHDQSDLPPDPEITFGTLDNGFRYVILPNEEPPERVSLRLLVKAGSLMETEEQRGLAHFVEHMAFRGTENFAPDEMVQYFQRLGMAFGPDTNAHTGFDQTVYYLDLPEASSELLNDGLLLLSDYADKMIFPKPEMEKERGVIIEEKKERDTASFRTFVAELNFIAPDTLLPERLPIGLEEVIRNAPREEFLNFYNRWYTPDRMVLVAVGEIDPERLEPKIKKHFADMEADDDPSDPPQLGKIEKRGVEAEIHREPEIGTARISIQAAKELEQKPDTKASRKEKMTLTLAAQMLNLRLDSLARQEDTPFSSAQAYVHDWFDYFRTPGASLSVDPEKWEQALPLLEQEIRRTLEHGFTDAEFEQAKKQQLHSYEREVRRRRTRNSRRLSTSIARSMVRGRVWTAPKTELELAQELFAELTPEDVRKTLRQSWPQGERLVFLSGKLPEDLSKAEVYRVLAQSMLTSVSAPEEKEIQQFAYTDFGEPGEIIDRQEHEDLGITEVQFDNNIAMLIKPTEFEDDVIRVSARFGGGLLSMPPEKPGLPLLSRQTFIEGGLGEHSREELRRIFAGQDVEAEFSIDDDAFLLQGRTSPRDLGRQFQLLTAYMQDPGYRPEALRMARDDLDQLYAQVRHTAGGVVQDRVNRFIHGGDPRFGVPSRRQVEKLDMEDVRDWLKPALEEGFLTVAVVGDVEVEEALQWGRETFGALDQREKEKPAYSEQRQIRFPDEEELKKFHFSTEIPRAAAIVYWPTEDMWDISRSRRLNFLSRVISDKLRERIREELGQAYSPRSMHQASDTYDDFGFMMALVTCQPQHASKITEKVREIGRELAQEGIDADLHQRVMAPLRARLREQVRSNRYWLRQVLLPAHEYPQRLDWARTMQEDMASITKEEINQLAEKYLGEENALRVIVLPEEKTEDQNE